MALAVCGDLVANNVLTVEARTAVMPGASLAVAGSTTNSAPLHVVGTMTSYGSIDARNTEDVTGDLQTAGAWNTSSPVQVGGNAFVASALAARNSVTVGGTLHVPSGTDINEVTAEAVAFGSVEVTQALDCASAPDIAALVARAWGVHDDPAEAALPRDAFENVSVPTVATLGCGTYALTSIGANNTLTLHVTGSTVLVIQGNVHIASPVVIDLAPGATLDLAIGGDLQIDNTLTVGDAAQPASTWVGVAGAIAIASPTVVRGALVAPRSAVSARNTLDVTGSAVFGGLEVSSPVTIHDGPALSAAGCQVAALEVDPTAEPPSQDGADMQGPAPDPRAPGETY